MANANNKTAADVGDFLSGLPDADRAKDCRALVAMMRKATGEKPRMWGASMVGFGQYHYKYESGREGDMFLVGFAPRKNDLTIYIVPGSAAYGNLIAKLGRHKTGKVCHYVKRLDDIDRDVLRELVTRSVAELRARQA